MVNSGSFPRGVTPEKPMHMPVNPTICQLMYDVGFIEKYGTGIYMMREICKEYGLSKPEYDISEIETKLIFKAGGKALIIPEFEKYGVECNARQKKALEFSFNKDFVTTGLYAEMNNVSRKT